MPQYPRGKRSSSRSFPSRSAPDVQGLVYEAVGSALQVSLPRGIINAVKEADRVTSKQLDFIAKALSRQAIPQSRLKAVHQDIGDAAQRSMLASYAQRKGRTGLRYRTGTPNDPRNKRYAGGKLRDALRNKGQVQATARGLSFINTTILNDQAKQWRRLNFGAGSRAGDSPRQFQVEWAGLVVASLGLQPDPRPAFALPRGFWVEPGGGGRQRPGARGTGEFYPTAERPGGIRGAPLKKRMTAGIAATNFLDAGVRAIAREFPVAYQALYRELYSQGKQERKRLEAKVGQTMVVPRLQNTRVRSRAYGR